MKTLLLVKLVRASFANVTKLLKPLENGCHFRVSNVSIPRPFTLPPPSRLSFIFWCECMDVLQAEDATAAMDLYKIARQEWEKSLSAAGKMRGRRAVVDQQDR